MNIQKFTKKSMEAVNDLQRIADEYGNQEVEQEHLLMALLRQDESLILKLIEKMGIATQHFTDRLEQLIAARPKVSGGQLVSVGDPVYRLATDEDWQIVFQANSQDEADELAEMEYVRVRFLKNQNESWGYVTSKTDPYGNVLVCLSFTNSMVTFCGDRFVDIELITTDRQGLKVPNSAIIESDFFLVPKDYLTTGRGGDRGVLKETYAEDGSRSTTFISSPPYSEAKGMYYLDESVLRAGDVLVKPNSADTYTLSAQDKLIGVYNINKGYADFRIIDIMYQNDEYSIVDPNTTYGLSEYDYIVLDAQNISPDQFVYD